MLCCLIRELKLVQWKWKHSVNCNLYRLSEAQLSQEDAIALLLQDKATPDAPQTLDSSTPGGVSDGASDVSSHSPSLHHADSQDATDQLETNPGLTMSPL